MSRKVSRQVEWIFERVLMISAGFKKIFIFSKTMLFLLGHSFSADGFFVSVFYLFGRKVSLFLFFEAKIGQISAYSGNQKLLSFLWLVLGMRQDGGGNLFFLFTQR